MFSSFKQRILLGIYIFLILSIPVGAYLVSQQQTVKSRASEATPKPTVKPSPKVATSSAKLTLPSVSDQDLKNLDSDSSTSPTVATSFGPTLSLKVSLEGRPAGSQATKLFVGIVEGTIYTNPKFLLSFSLDLPESGSYDNLSLAGLTPGTKYTALLKGSAQIATASAFYMAPAVTNLNDGQAVNLTSGDLNDDNVVNSADYSIVQKAYGANPKSSNWNGTADFNKDGVINIFDLSIVAKNSGQIGASGIWTSPVPKTGTPSGAISSQGSPGGYWLWVSGN